MISTFKLNHFFKFSSSSRFLAFEKAYGERFLLFPLFPSVADVAEYINLILFFKQKLNTAFEPMIFDLKQSSNFKKL